MSDLRDLHVARPADALRERPVPLGPADEVVFADVDQRRARDSIQQWHDVVVECGRIPEVGNLHVHAKLRWSRAIWPSAGSESGSAKYSGQQSLNVRTNSSSVISRES